MNRGTVTCLGAWIFGLVAALPLLGAGKPDIELEKIRDGFPARRDVVLQRQVDNTYPVLSEKSDDQLFSWHKLDYALSALFMNVEIEAANRAVLEVAAKGVEQRIAAGEERFHWIAPLLIRTYELFHAGSNDLPGRLTPEAEEAIRQVLWEYARGRCKLELYQPDRIWWLWGSENHDAQRLQSLWGATRILSQSTKYRERVFQDGHRPARHYQAISEFVAERFRERIRKGLLAETASPGYSKYTLGCWYNYYDFGDPELSRLAGAALTVWWTDWALEQIDAIRGGAKARVYQGEQTRRGKIDCAAAMAWYYLAIGSPRNAHPGMMCLATSRYRLPLVVMDIALDIEGRGTYEYRSRRPGLLDRGPSEIARQDDMYALDAACGGLARYTFCTPDFILGSWVLEKRPLADWAAISSQNRWQGVVFAGNDPDARIFPQCEGLRNGKTYNQYWSAQVKGTMVVRKLPGPGFSKQAGDMRVFFAASLKRHEENGWIFAEADRAYAAVRFAGKGQTYRWDDSNWARSLDSTQPVIFEVASKRDYGDLDAFQEAVVSKRCELDDERLLYGGSDDTPTIMFPLSDNGLPEVDGVAINPSLPMTFDCPYMREEYASGIVTIAKGSRQVTINVTAQD